MSLQSVDELQSATCEHDEQWLEVKRRLFSVLDGVVESAEMDLARHLNLLARGIAPADLQRCPMGAISVQLFMQWTLSITDPAVILSELFADPWREEPWDVLAPLDW